MVNRSVTNLVLDATYLNRVNRVNGPDSPQGVYKGDGFLLNAGYQTKIGKLSAFGYLLDFEPITNIPAGINPIRDSTSTYGLRFAGDKPVGKIKLAYAASYATQTDYGDNPLDFDLDYMFGELNATFRQFGLGVGTEIMEGNGLAGTAGKGFTTPLATLHKFQGWADKFLTTPPNGLEDLYANASVNLKGVGVLDTLAFIVSYHDYNARSDLGRLRQRVERVHRRETQAFQPDAQVRGLPAGRAGVGAHHSQAVGADRIRLVMPVPGTDILPIDDRGEGIRCLIWLQQSSSPRWSTPANRRFSCRPATHSSARSWPARSWRWLPCSPSW